MKGKHTINHILKKKFTCLWFVIYLNIGLLILLPKKVKINYLQVKVEGIFFFKEYTQYMKLWQD